MDMDMDRERDRAVAPGYITQTLTPDPLHDHTPNPNPVVVFYPSDLDIAMVAPGSGQDDCVVAGLCVVVLGLGLYRVRLRGWSI